jgi:hypothetical protein
MTKSPFNEAVGKLIASLRSKRNESVQSTAQAFNLSDVYLRAIEAGHRPIPAYSVVGLVRHLRMAWPAASALVAMASFLDAREGKGYAAPGLRSRLESLRHAHPAYSELLDNVEELIRWRGSRSDKLSPSDDALWGDRVTRLQELLQETLEALEPRDTFERGHVGDLNPVVEDFLDRLGEQLALVSHHINQDELLEWENRNSHRIVGLYGYLSDGSILEQSLGTFEWAFVRNSHSPAVRILVQDDTAAASAFGEALRHGLIRKTRTLPSIRKKLSTDLARRIRVESASSKLPRCRQGLWFDLVNSSRPTRPQTAESEQFKEFRNSWIYELEPVPGRQVPRRVGFLDNYDRKIGPGYAVAMDSKHVEYWMDVFAGTPASPRRRIEPNPTKRS